MYQKYALPIFSTAENNRSHCHEKYDKVEDYLSSQPKKTEGNSSTHIQVIYRDNNSNNNKIKSSCTICFVVARLFFLRKQSRCRQNEHKFVMKEFVLQRNTTYLQQLAVLDVLFPLPFNVGQCWPRNRTNPPENHD